MSINKKLTQTPPQSSGFFYPFKKQPLTELLGYVWDIQLRAQQPQGAKPMDTNVTQNAKVPTNQNGEKRTTDKAITKFTEVTKDTIVFCGVCALAGFFFVAGGKIADAILSIL